MSTIPSALEAALETQSFTPVTETTTPSPDTTKAIIDQLPDHTTYVEPCAANGALVGLKPPSRNEVVNDPTGDLIHFYETIHNELDAVAEFLASTPLTDDIRAEWSSVFTRGFRHRNDVVRAGQYYVQFGIGDNITESRFDDKEPIATGLTQFRDRFNEVVIESRPPHELIADYDAEDVCLFFDPVLDAQRHEYGVKSTNIRFLRQLMEWQSAVSEPCWALLTSDVPSPLSMLRTADIGEQTLIANYSFEQPHIEPFEATASAPTLDTFRLESGVTS